MSSQEMRVFTDSGVEVLSVQSERERSAVGDHWNTIRRFLESGEAKLLRAHRSRTVAGRSLETDPSVIEAWAAQGQLDFEDIYSS